MKNKILSTFSRVVLLVSGLLFIGSIFVPMWKIELSAPQYPEGLVLKLHATKIAGDVDIINGLNHYIGMKTLHSEDFIEFKILPYILAGFALTAFIIALWAKPGALKILFISFVLFGITAGIDFYHWNYQYGHNLDPNAAIRVPGMAYQPPVLGYKQLLNFGAYSTPDTGGWLLIGVGGLLLLAIIKEKYSVSKLDKYFSVLIITFFLISCSGDKPIPIKINEESCDFCKMGISDPKHGAEIITQKGRAYKFDDIACMINYCKENKELKVKAYYVHDYTKNNELILAQTAFFISGGSIKTPMNGKIAAFSAKSQAKAFQAEFRAEEIEWTAIQKK